MRNNLIILKVIFTLMIFSGCAKPQPRNETQEKIEYGSEDGPNDRNTSIQTHPKNQIDSLNAIIPQETHLFQLFKDGFEKFKIPIQASVIEEDPHGLFPEIFNGYKQRLKNPTDTLKYDIKSDTIYWINQYFATGITHRKLLNWKDLKKVDLKKDPRENELIWYNLLKNGEKDSLRNIFVYWKKKIFPSSNIYLGMMVIKDNRVVKIDTAHYGELYSRGGEDGSFFEIPDSIYEMYCRRPDKK